MIYWNTCLNISSRVTTLKSFRCGTCTARDKAVVWISSSILVPTTKAMLGFQLSYLQNKILNALEQKHTKCFSAVSRSKPAEMTTLFKTCSTLKYESHWNKLYNPKKHVQLCPNSFFHQVAALCCGKHKRLETLQKPPHRQKPH